MLFRTELAAGPADYPPMAEVTSDEQKDGVQFAIDLVVVNPVVDRQSYAYWTYVQLPPTNSVGLIGARVDYKFDAYLPLTVKP